MHPPAHHENTLPLQPISELKQPINSENSAKLSKKGMVREETGSMNTSWDMAKRKLSGAAELEKVSERDGM